MPIPPTYADLGKQSREVFNKGYHFGLYKLDLKTKTPNKVEFNVGGQSSHDSGKVTGSLEAKYKFVDYGLTFSEKWNTENQLTTEISVEDQLCKGLKIALDSTFSPDTGKKTGRVKTAYKMENLNLNCDVDLNLAGPEVHGAAVLGYQGWLVGYQLSYNTAQSALSRSNFALGYQSSDLVLHTNVNDGQEFGASVYQRVNENTETGVQLSWAAGNNETRFGLGAKYKLDENTSLGAKVNNSSQIGLGYQQKLRAGVTLTLSTLIDGKSLDQGGHKVGLALELQD